MKKFTTLIILYLTSFSVLAGLVEWPIYVGPNLKGENDNRPISHYIISGNFSDGSPTVKRIDEVTIRYFSRSIEPPEFSTYFVYELNCRSGAERLFSTGSLSHQKVFTAEQKSSNINDAREDVLPAYREVCREGGVPFSKKDTPLPNKGRISKKSIL